MRRLLALALPAVLLLPALPLAAASEDIPPHTSGAGCAIAAWYAELAAKHSVGTAVPLKLDPTDEQLATLGLPPRVALAGRSFPEPTMLLPDGTGIPTRLALPAVATYAGLGCLGIRPGALLLNFNGGVAICSMAHVYGSPGAYQISTAGHCTKAGEKVSVVAAFGNHAGALAPIVLDFGTTKTSHDNGIGDDFALISVASAYQNLVSPTMCFWAGPRGAFTYTSPGGPNVVGASVAISGQLLSPHITPEVALNPDPNLVQGIVHYGHGIGFGGPGVGTPRAGEAIYWSGDTLAFTTLSSPGDSGSGINTATGQAAGILTHLVVGPLLGYGEAIGAGTRVTQVPATLADGQLVAYPMPAPGLP
jgi:hypothetical protein